MSSMPLPLGNSIKITNYADVITITTTGSKSKLETTVQPYLQDLYNWMESRNL